MTTTFTIPVTITIPTDDRRAVDDKIATLRTAFRTIAHDNLDDDDYGDAEVVVSVAAAIIEAPSLARTFEPSLGGRFMAVLWADIKAGDVIDNMDEAVYADADAEQFTDGGVRLARVRGHIEGGRPGTWVYPRAYSVTIFRKDPS
jgi:hypothetical protein